MADYEPASFYAPWPLFGKKFSAQLDEIRHNQDALAPLVDATGYDLTVGSRELRDSAVFSREWGQEDFHNKFRIRWNKGAEDVEFQCNQGTEAVPNWETYFYIGCGDREIVSLENFITEKDVSVGGDFYVKGSAFIAGSGEINTGSSLGGDADVFKQKSTFDLQFRGLTAGSNITLTENANDIEIASSASGGGGGFYGVIFKETEVNGTIYRDDQLNVDSNFFYLSEGGDGKPILSWLSGSVGEANTLTSAGGDEGLAASQAGTVLRTKGLTAGNQINLSSDASSVTIDLERVVTAEAFYIGPHNSGISDDGSGNLIIDANGNYIRFVENAIAGDPGLEGDSISVGGTAYESVLKASDIGGANEANFHIHRHSNSLPAVLVSSRARGTTSGHTTIQDGDQAFAIIATAWGDSTYEVLGRINFVVDAIDGSTPGNDNMPGRIDFRTQPPGSGTLNPTLAMSIHPDQHVRMENTLNVENAVTAEAFYTKSDGEVGPITFAETEAGGASVFTKRLNLDSTFFYLSSSGGDGFPILSSFPGAGSGETNDAVSLGGTSIVGSPSKSGVNLQFKGLTAGSNIDFTGSDSTQITINSTAAGGGGGGFYGVIFKETEAGGAVFRDDQLNVDSTYFYLSSSTDAKPLLSLNGVPKMEIHHRATAATEWQISHSLNTAHLIAQAWDTGNQLVIPDKVDTSNPSLTYFYFSPALAGYATLTGIPA